MQELRSSSVAATVDFERKGTQHGHLRLPYSRDDSAWGSVTIPTAVISNGEGPTALLSGGNHGDEYEGPIALFDLARTLRPEQVTGRIIIVPAMNYPAFRTGTRTSPIDRGNLNRSFPGRPDGTITERIADYFTRYLLPLADVVLDFHSGGRTLEFLPYAAAHELHDKDQERRCLEAVAAFAAPYSMRMIEIDAAGMYDTVAEEMGKVFVTTELGGGGTATARTSRIARRGVRNVLHHVGILRGKPDQADEPPSRWLDMPGVDCFSFAEEEGLVEPLKDLGDAVREGELIAHIHPTGRTGNTPFEQRAAREGVLAARHFPGLVKSGDCLAVIATMSDEQPFDHWSGHSQESQAQPPNPSQRET